LSNDMIRPENNNLPANAGELAGMIREIMAPVISGMTEMLKNNTEAMEQIAAVQQVTNTRIEALEKQIRLNTPCTAIQARYLNDAMRKRARALLEEKQEGAGDNRKMVNKLTASIRKSVFSRYGVSATRDIPRHEYEVALNQIGMWKDYIAIRDVMRASRGEEASE